MKLNSPRAEWLQILLLAAPFCAVALLWADLPYWVPIHWNARGEVDGYARKAMGTLLLPAINLIVALVLGLLPMIDPKLGKQDPDVRASLWRTIKVIRLAITGFLTLLSLAMLAAALGAFKDSAQFTTVIHLGIAGLFILLGNFLTKLRPNYFVGIRTPWTLESKEVWTKTHRVGGRLMIMGGSLMLALSLIVPLERYVYWVLLPVSLGISLFSIVYSYALYRKQRATQQTSLH